MNTPQPIERHPLGFLLPPHTKFLMLGSFPPPQNRRSMNFYYPNFQNDMRRILGSIFYNDKEYFITQNKKAFDEQKARTFCREKGIGIGDTAEEVIRLSGNASDDKLQVVRAFNLMEILKQIPECQAIVITGQKAMETLLSIFPIPEPKI
jgi:G:T/U-mismatch repair DNA glycosylase